MPTLEQVQAHDRAESCWIIIHGVVYGKTPSRLVALQSSQSSIRWAKLCIPGVMVLTAYVTLT
jgi:hypothetical protein